MMMLCHGTRIGETRQARWEHISFSERSWFIPAQNTKTRQAHRLPLTDPLITWLQAYQLQQQETGYAGVHLFPASRGRTPLGATRASELIKGVSRGRWSAHDLRKVARTIWADLGTDYMVGELLLNHALTKLDRTYIHTYAERQCREALERYHDWLMGQGWKINSAG
jgi:integrase